MSGQVLFFRTCSLLSNSGAFLKNRVLSVILLPPVRDLKQETLEKLKLLKIPEKPKKPLAPYAKFISEHRAKIVRDNPNLKPTEIFKKCAEDWKNINEELKDKYNVAFKNEFAVYAQKLLTYNANLTQEQKEMLEIANKEKESSKKKRIIKKIEKDTNKPKRPMSMYALYIQEQSKIRNLSSKDLIPSLKDEWSKLSEEKKDKYKNLFLKERQRYEMAMEEWEEKMIKDGRDDLIRAKSKDKLKITRIRKLKKGDSQ